MRNPGTEGLLGERRQREIGRFSGHEARPTVQQLMGEMLSGWLASFRAAAPPLHGRVMDLYQQAPSKLTWHSKGRLHERHAAQTLFLMPRKTAELHTSGHGLAVCVTALVMSRGAPPNWLQYMIEVVIGCSGMGYASLVS